MTDKQEIKFFPNVIAGSRKQIEMINFKLDEEHLKNEPDSKRITRWTNLINEHTEAIKILKYPRTKEIVEKDILEQYSN